MGVSIAKELSDGSYGISYLDAAKAGIETPLTKGLNR